MSEGKSKKELKSKPRGNALSITFPKKDNKTAWMENTEKHKHETCDNHEEIREEKQPRDDNCGGISSGGIGSKKTARATKGVKLGHITEAANRKSSSKNNDSDRSEKLGTQGSKSLSKNIKGKADERISLLEQISDDNFIEEKPESSDPKELISRKAIVKSNRPVTKPVSFGTYHFPGIH